MNNETHAGIIRRFSTDRDLSVLSHENVGNKKPCIFTKRFRANFCENHSAIVTQSG